jgi:hypothetical protein
MNFTYGSNVSAGNSARRIIVELAARLLDYRESGAAATEIRR